MPELLKDKQIIALPVKNHQPITGLFPAGKWVYRDGKLYLPYTLDTMKLLVQVLTTLAKDKGEAVADRLIDDMAVIKHKYILPQVEMIYPLHWWQVKTAAFITTYRRCFVLNDPRTGKSASALTAVDFLLEQGEIDCAIIIAPKSCLSSVWEDEHCGMLPLRKMQVITGEAKKRLQKLRDKAEVYVINPDALSRTPALGKQVAAMVATRRVMIVVDESTEYGNEGSARWKAIAPACAKVKYLVLMTGTPGDPSTVYGQAKLMGSPHIPDSRAVWEAMTMRKAFTVPIQIKKGNSVKVIDKQIFKPNEYAEEHIKRVLSPAIRIKKAEVMAYMPKLLTISRRVPLSADQQSIYDMLRKDKGGIINGVQFIPANGAVLGGKMMEVASGTLKVTKDGQAVKSFELPVEEKFEQLMQIFRETPEKKLVFANNILTVEMLTRMINEAGYSAKMVNGSVTGTTRDDIFRDFMKPDGIHCMVCHPRTVSYGVEAGIADALVWWGPPLVNAFLYKQANERLMSSKQTSQLPTVYQLWSTPEEKQVFAKLDAGVSWQEAAADLFKIT